MHIFPIHFHLLHSKFYGCSQVYMIICHGWLGQDGLHCKQTRHWAFQTLCQVWFSLKASKAWPTVGKARPSDWKAPPSVQKARTCVLRQVRGRMFRKRKSMKIWSVKSTSLVESSVINLINLHFIINTYSYSLRHRDSYTLICSISYICKTTKSWFQNEYLKKKKRQNWKQTSEALLRAQDLY